MDMKFYSYLRRSTDGVVFDGFDLLEEEFMVHIARDVKKFYLDGTLYPESFASIRLPLYEKHGQRFCDEPLFCEMVESYGLFDWPFFVLIRKIYAASSFPMNK